MLVLEVWIVTFCVSLVENVALESVKGKGKAMERDTEKEMEGEEQRICVFFLACCARGVRSNTWLLEGERARIYVPICCCDSGICVFNLHFCVTRCDILVLLHATTLRYISPFTHSPQTHFCVCTW